MKYATGGEVAVKTGPNNAPGIVWAISEFFFIYSSFFWILTNVYSIYIMIYNVHSGKGGNNKNRPKWMRLSLFGPQMHHLGHK